MDKEKVVVVTGASSGIGKEIWSEYKLQQGYEVYGLSRRGPDIKLDLSSRIGIFQLQTNIKPAILINCAGVMPLTNETHEVMDINFWAAYHLTQIFMWPGLELVINIASVAAHKPDPHQPIYAASKAALIAMTKSYAKRYAKRYGGGGGLRFNTISPGFVESNLVEGDTPENLISEIPVGYEAHPSEIFTAVKFIEDCGYLTGADIIVDGGLTC